MRREAEEILGRSEHPQLMRRWLLMRSPRPRRFEEVVAAQDPTEKARLERGEHFTDPSVSPFHGEVSVNEDRHGSGEWRVTCSPTCPRL